MTMLDRPPPVESTLSAGAFVRRTGLSYRQLDHWTRSGVLATVRPAAGSGSRRTYASAEVGVAAALMSLCHLLGGAGRGAMLRAVATALRSAPGASWVRLDGSTATPVAAPTGDGALYLSVPS